MDPKTILTLAAVIGAAPWLTACGSPAAPPAAHLSASTLDLPPTLCGTTQTTRIDLDNPGGSPLHWDALLSELPGASVTPPSGTLDPGAHVTLEVSVPAPTDQGLVDLRGTLVVQSDAGEGARLEVPVATRTTGAVLRFAKVGIDFGQVPSGATSPPLPISVINDGDLAIDVRLDVRPPFSVAWETGLHVEPGATAIAQGRFSPQELGDVSAVLAIGGGPGVCQVAAMKAVGRGVDGVVGITPGALDFGEVDCGTNATASVIVFNTSKEPFDAMLSLKTPTFLYMLKLPSATVPAEGQVTFPVEVYVGVINGGSPAPFYNELGIVTKAPKDLPHALPVSTTPRGAQLEFAGPTADLGVTRLDQPAVPGVVDLFNLGNAPATVSLQLAAPMGAPATVTVPKLGKVSIPITRGAGDELGVSIARTLQVSTSDVTCAGAPSLDLTTKYTDRAQRIATGRARIEVLAKSGHVYERTTWPVTNYVRVPGLSGVTAEIAAYTSAACARLATGAVRCWGQNTLGNGSSSSSTPVDVTGIATATSLEAQGDRVCAVLADNTVRCWGYDWQCTFGDCQPRGYVLTPQPVLGLGNVSRMALGYRHQCAVTVSGTALCWGHNSTGELGDGSPLYTEQPTPTLVQGPTGITSIVAGGAGTCALGVYGHIWCWGNAVPAGFGNPTMVPAQVAFGTSLDIEYDYGYGATVWVVRPQGSLSELRWWWPGSYPNANYTDAKQVSARGGIPCLVRSDGKVSCRDGYGEPPVFVDEPGFD